MYPPKFNLYRISRGIKKPFEYTDKYYKVKEKEGLGEPSFKKAISITSNDFDNLIIYEQYNKNRKTCK